MRPPASRCAGCDRRTDRPIRSGRGTSPDRAAARSLALGIVTAILESAPVYFLQARPVHAGESHRPDDPRDQGLQDDAAGPWIEIGKGGAVAGRQKNGGGSANSKTLG